MTAITTLKALTAKPLFSQSFLDEVAASKKSTAPIIPTAKSKHFTLKAKKMTVNIHYHN